MKKIAFALLASTLLAGNVMAAELHVPFINKFVPKEGLRFSYNTNNSEKVACVADNFYKGDVSITLNGVERYTGVAFSDYDTQQFYFTSVGADNLDMQGDLDQFHVDKSGHIILKDTNYDAHSAYVSCFYVPEAQVAK